MVNGHVVSVRGVGLGLVVVNGLSACKRQARNVAHYGGKYGLGGLPAPRKESYGKFGVGVYMYLSTVGTTLDARKNGIEFGLVIGSAKHATVQLPINKARPPPETSRTRTVRPYIHATSITRFTKTTSQNWWLALHFSRTF